MAGDDGVGIAAARRARDICELRDVEVTEIAEPSALVPLLIDGTSPVVLIDAVVGGGEPGQVLHADLDPGRPSLRLLSCHGIGVREAIALAKTLQPESVAEKIEIVAVTIPPPSRYSEMLSPEVAAAIDSAASLALRLAAS
jgi:hydrogenase maturation protease